LDGAAPEAPGALDEVVEDADVELALDESVLLGVSAPLSFFPSVLVLPSDWPLFA